MLELFISESKNDATVPSVGGMGGWDGLSGSSQSAALENYCGTAWRPFPALEEVRPDGRILLAVPVPVSQRPLYPFGQVDGLPGCFFPPRFPYSSLPERRWWGCRAGQGEQQPLRWAGRRDAEAQSSHPHPLREETPCAKGRGTPALASCSWPGMSWRSRMGIAPGRLSLGRRDARLCPLLPRLVQTARPVGAGRRLLICQASFLTPLWHLGIQKALVPLIFLVGRE